LRQEPVTKPAAPIRRSRQKRRIRRCHRQNQWNGTYTLSGYNVVCGDQQLTGNTTINAPSGAVLVIENGQLDTNGYTLSGSALTIVFTGSNSASYQHTPTGGAAIWTSLRRHPVLGAGWRFTALTTNVDIAAAAVIDSRRAAFGSRRPTNPTSRLTPRKKRSFEGF
jgi:hypothetical protein